MQLIRTDQLFRLLGNGAVLGGGQQLGADWGVQNVKQHPAQRVAAAGVCYILHDMPHKRLGHAGIDAVHAHVVAVVGGPAQCKLAQIAGADDKATILVGVIHQLQCAHAGLTVFKGDIIFVGRLSDVCKVTFDSLRDIDLGEGHAQRLTQNLGVGAGALCGAEARHCQRYNVLGIAVQNLAGAHGHQQGQTTVQPAGDADHPAFGVGMLHPLGKALCLNAQDQLTALGAGGSVLRHEGRAGDRARQGKADRRQIKFYRGIASRFRHKGRVALTLLHHAAKIQLGHGSLACKGGGVGQQTAVFGNQIVPGKGHVGGAFPMAGIGVEIGAEQPRTLPADERPAVGRLADGLITGGEICHHRGPGQRVGAAWRDRRPQILTDLGGQHKGRHLLAGKQQVGADQRFLPGQLDALRLGHARDEMALLVKLAVVGQMQLWYKAQQLAVAHNGGAVVQFAVAAHRQADQNHKVEALTGL